MHGIQKTQYTYTQIKNGNNFEYQQWPKDFKMALNFYPSSIRNLTDILLIVGLFGILEPTEQREYVTVYDYKWLFCSGIQMVYSIMVYI